MAAPADGDDAEIVALSAEVLRRCEIAAEFMATRIEPFEETYHALIHADPRNENECMARASAYSHETGREDAVKEHWDYGEETDRVFDRMMAIQAKTQAGRAAKLRALLVNIMGEEWRGPAEPLDYEKDMARALLGEFAGLSADELAAI
jgi:hypothetical protein